MKSRLLNHLKTTILLLGGGLVALTSLASCDNFLNGGQIKNEIEEAIAYNNAKNISVLIQSEEGTGTTVPAGNYTVKQSYNFDVSFTESAAYSFNKWIAVAKDDPSKIITDGVSFTDETSPKTKFKITNDSISIRLIPQCIERIAFAREPSPGFSSTGVSRNSPIHVDFTKALNPSNFIFTQAEIPSSAEVVKDDDGNIWAYISEGETFFKNIQITDNNGFSLAGYFTKPEVSGSSLTIQTDAQNPIPFMTGDTTKTIVVTISKDITDTNQVAMNTEKSWRYLVNDSTTEKASISFVNNLTEGSITSVSRDYSIGQTLKLSFIENTGYQFIRWDYDSDILLVDEPDSLETTALVLKKTEGSDSTKVRALCAERLAIIDYSPKSAEAVCKNSSIWIKFNHSIKEADADKIVIAIGGTTVKSSFITPPVVSGQTVTFKADKSNLIDVPAGKTKTISVSVPNDLSYEYDDNGSAVKVFYGGNGAAFDYKIKDETEEKAFVEITATTNSGTVEPAGAKDYSLDSEVPISFVPAAGWQFNGWKLTDSEGNEISETIVKLANKKALETTLYVYQELGTENKRIKVKAEASEKLTVSCSPSSGVQPKDTSIVLTFNKPLPEALDLSKIKVTLDGANVTSYFTPEKNGNKITLTNTKNLNVTGNDRKTVSVIVPETIYYLDGEKQICLEDAQTFDYEVKSETTSKTNVQFVVKSGSGSINQGDSKSYNIGETVDLKYALTDGWQFNGWEIKANGADVSEDKIYIEDTNALNTKLHIYGQVSDVTITAKANLLPAVISYTPANDSSYYTFTPIVITFNRQMEALNISADDSIFKYDANNISLKVDNTTVTDYFEKPVIDSTKKILTLTPKGTLLMKYIEDHNLPYVDVKVIFGSAIAIHEDSLVLPLLKNDNSTIYVRYKGSRETEPPKIVDYFVTNKPFTLATVDTITDDDKFLFKQWDDFTEEDGFRNYVSDSFYVYGYCNDIDSGIESVQLRVTVYDKTTTYLYTREKNNMEYEDLGNGYFKFCINFATTTRGQQSSLNHYDIETIVIDKLENETKTKALSFTDFNTSISYACSMVSDSRKYSGITIENTRDDPKKVFLHNWGGGLTTSRWNEFRLKFPKASSETNLLTINSVIYCEYVDKFGVKRLEQFYKSSEDKYVLLDLDELPGVEIKMVVKYKYGDKEIPIGYQKCRFPYKPVITKYASGNYTFAGSYYSRDYVASYYALDDNGEETGEFTDHTIYDRSSSTSYNPTNTRNLYVYACCWTDVDSHNSNISDYYHYWTKLYSGEYLGPFVYGNPPTSPTRPVIEVREVKKSAEPGKWDVTFAVKDWKNCEAIVRSVSSDTKSYITDDVFTLSYDPYSMYTGSGFDIFEFYGIKDSMITQNSTSVNLMRERFTQEELVELDVVPPKFKAPVSSIPLADLTEANWSENFFEIKVTDDYGSGVKEAYAYLGKKKYESEDYEEGGEVVGKVIKIPFTNIQTGTTKIQEYAEDNAGNKKETQLEIKTDEPSGYTKYDEYIEFIYSYIKKIIYTLSSSYWKNFDISSVSWHKELTIESYAPSEDQKITYSTNSAYQDSFVKVVNLYNSSSSLTCNYRIIYTGAAGNSKYNVIFSGAKDAMAVASDAPVLIHTVSTSQDYETVKNWTARQWETITNNSWGEYTYNFTSTDYSPRLYNIPIDKIRSGDCYVVIAHFSNNEVLMSEVMQMD